MSVSSNRRDRRRGGFTLIEVLIAFAILAVALTALIQAFSQGLRASAVAEEHATAVLLARSKLAEVGRSVPLEESEHSGDFEKGLAWRLEIGAPQDGAFDMGEGAGFRVYEITVSIHAGERRLLDVSTVRVGPER